ncbi:ABC transporter permease [Ruegeria atlantica]|uniref:ABC transporter permease n=1 Tax=Ruegeria atlantica TaxID=81569 RepID=UPI0024944AE9|nr:ABC transporter permease [Ruegeria atlantica]
MLGIIVGVASVVSMVAFASGAQREVARQIQTLGANVLMIAPEWIQATGISDGQYELAVLNELDAKALVEIVPEIALAAPSVRDDLQVINNKNSVWVTVNGTTSTYFSVREWPLQSGRHFSSQELSGAAKVALLGRDTAQSLFGDENPLGKTIRILKAPFEVIGVLAKKGTAGSGRAQDEVVFVPISTAKRRLFGSSNVTDRGAVDYILVKATSTRAVRDVNQAVSDLLRQRHRLRSDQEDDFRVVNPAATMEAQNAAKKTIGWLLAGIASVSLIVGGISIMNIMLVSVAERTREIGLRIAIGARPMDVQYQFLMESILLCFIGGLIGLLIGGGLAIVVSNLAGWPVYLSPLSMIGSIGLATVVGMVFGYIPARYASRLDPVAALKFE